MDDLVEVTQADREAVHRLMIGEQVGGGDGGTYLIRQPRLSECYEAFARHRLSAIPSGYKLVPIEPMQAMREAGTEVPVDDGRGRNTALNWEESDAVWSAMLNAAPEMGG